MSNRSPRPLRRRLPLRQYMPDEMAMTHKQAKAWTMVAVVSTHRLVDWLASIRLTAVTIYLIKQVHTSFFPYRLQKYKEILNLTSFYQKTRRK